MVNFSPSKFSLSTDIVFDFSGFEWFANGRKFWPTQEFPKKNNAHKTTEIAREIMEAK